MPIVAETTVTSEVIPMTEQLTTNEIISEPVEDVALKVVSSDKKPLTESQELNKLPEYQKGSKASFYKAFKSSEQTLIDKDKALAAQASELSLAYSEWNKRLNLLMEEQKVTAQETAVLEAKIASLEEHITSLKEGKPQMIPLFGKERLSYQSDFDLRVSEHNKEWNDLVKQTKNAYNDYQPKVVKWLKDMKHRLQTVELD